MITVLLSIVGFINAAYLLLLSTSQSSDYCVSGLDCSTVLQSAYANFFGIPLYVLGLSFFLAVIGLTYYNHKSNNEAINLQISFTAIGLIFSLYLVALQLFVIQSFCPFCSLSALLVTILFVLSFRQRKDGLWPPSTALIKEPVFITVLSLFSIPVILFLFVALINSRFDISFQPKYLAHSNLGSFSEEDINNMAGIKHFELSANQYNLRKESILAHFVRLDRTELNLSEQAYYNAFVKHQLSLLDEDVRKELKFANMKGQLNIYLEDVNETAPTALSDRYQLMLDQIQEKYAIRFNLQPIQKIELSPNDVYTITYGSEDADIHITVFSDFLCSHCAKFHNQLKAYIQQYPDLFYVQYRHYPIVDHGSKLIAKLAICADQQNAYEQLAQEYYNNQDEISPQNLFTFVPKSLDQAKMQRCFNSPAAEEAIRVDQAEAARLNMKYTPTVIVNGYLGTQAIIESEIRKLQ